MLLIIIAILFFVAWFIVSVSSMIYWFQIPITKIRNEQTDLTKKIAYYYGFAFFIFLDVVAVGSMVGVFVKLIINALGI